MSTSKISPTECGRQKLANCFCQSHGAASHNFLVLPGTFGTNTSCILTKPDIEIVLERGISLSYLVSNEVVKTGYEMLLASISQGFVIYFVLRMRAKAAVAALEYSNILSIYCVLLSRRHTKFSRIYNAFSPEVNVNSCVIAIEIQGDFIVGVHFVSADLTNSKKVSVEFDPSTPFFHNAVVWVLDAILITFIGRKTLFFSKNKSSINDIYSLKSFSISLFQSKNGHKTPLIRSAAGGQIQQTQQVHALYTNRGCGMPTSPHQLASSVLSGVNHG